MLTKVCNTCGIDKPVDAFSLERKGTDKRQRKCKACCKQYFKNHYKKNKKYYKDKARSRDEVEEKKIDLLLAEFRKNGCSRCTERDPVCLDAHHVDPKLKDFEIGRAKRSRISAARVAVELSKCECVCANCHRKIHFQCDLLR